MPPKRPQHPPLILVKWLDANHGIGELPIEDCSLSELWNVGYLVAEDDLAVKLDMEWSPDDPLPQESRHWMNIPKDRITSIQPLTIKKERHAKPPTAETL